MNTRATIHHRPTWIRGWPNSGWRFAEPTDAEAKQLPFNFEIKDDGAGHYLLVYSSADRVYSADSWHETLDEAYGLAEALGTRRVDWVLAS